MDDPHLIHGFCPHCKIEANLIVPSEWWIPSHCSTCGKTIDPEDYDLAAARCISRISVLSVKLGRLRKTSAALSDAARVRRAIGSALLRFANRFVLRPRMKRAAKVLSCRNDELAVLADSRYRLGPWHRCSKIPLLPSSHTGSARSRLKSVYQKDGMFRLMGNDGRSAGIAGEFVVFEQLYAASRTESSPMTDARICHNLFLPSCRSSEQSTLAETDLIILTRSAAMVCEVKRWRAAIRYLPHLRAILTHRAGERTSALDGYSDDERPLEQVRSRWRDFKRLDHYPEDRIFCALIFVNPVAFDAPTDGFVDSCLVASCYEEEKGSLVEALCGKLSGYSPIFEQSEVDALALSIQDEHGDPDGAKARAQRHIYEQLSDAKTATSKQGTRSNAGLVSPDRIEQKRSKKKAKRKAFQQNRSQSKVHRRRRQRIEEDTLSESLRDYDRWHLE